MDRVAIAKDVIEQVNALKFIPVVGAYCHFINDVPCNGPLQEQLSELGGCGVCAIGSLLVSHARLSNAVEWRCEPHESGPKAAFFYEALKDVFSWDQLQMIESAYEVREASCLARALVKEALKREDPKIEASINFGLKFGTFNEKSDNPDQWNKRLIGIMQNIIDNDGEFKP